MDFAKYFLKPFLAALVMGGVVLGTHSLLCAAGNTVAVLLSIAVGIIVYFTMLGILRTLSREELSMLPVIGKKFKK